MSDQILSNLERLINNEISELDLWIERYTSNLSSIAASAALRDPVSNLLKTSENTSSRNDIRNEFDSFLLSNPSFYNIFLMDPVSGKVLVSSDISLEGKDYSAESFFQHGQSDLFTTPIYQTSPLRKYTITASYPIKTDDGHLIGVLGGDINVSATDEVLGNPSDLLTDLNIYLNKSDLSGIAVSSTLRNSITNLLKVSDDTSSKDKIRAEFDRYLFYNPSFYNIFLMDPVSGRILVSSDISMEGTDYSTETFFQHGQSDLFTTPIYQIPTLRKYTITVSYPVRTDDGRLIGVLGGNINVSAANEVLGDPSDLPTALDIYLISPEHMFLAGWAPDLELSGKDSQLNSDAITAAFNGKEISGNYLNYNNKSVIGFYNYIPKLNAAIIAEQPISVAFAPLRELLVKIFVVSLLIIILALFIGLFVARRITNPLHSLTIIAQKISHGAHLKANITSKDEIGELANAFNAMTDQLIVSSKWNERIIETVPSALFLLDSNGYILRCNKAAERITEHNRKMFIGQLYTDFIRFRDVKTNRPNKLSINEICKDKIIQDIPASLTPKGHLAFPISLSGSMLTDNQGKIFYLLAIRDLREFKKYAHEKVESITSILNRISVGDFSYNVKLPDSPDEFTELLVAVDLMGRNLRALIEENRNKAELLETSQKKIEMSYKSVKKSKEEAEREKTKVEAILANMGEGLIVINPHGNVLVMNNSAELMFGKSVENVLGKPFNEFFVFKNDRGQIIQPNVYPIFDAIKKQKQIFTTTYFIKQDKSSIPLATACSPILFGKKLFGVIVTFRDITKETEVDKAKSEFVSIASHQLRTPLTGIRWLIEAVLKKGKLSIWQTEFLHDALQSNNRMIGLVNDLLNLSRLETGAISVQPTSIELIKFLKDIVRDYSIVAKDDGKAVQFENKVKTLFIKCDSQLLTQVVANLLSNAIKYTSKKSIVYLFVRKKKGNVEISVKDSGIGISKEDQKRLFTKFFRTDQATKMATTGSGLGLYIIRKILLILEGKITCTSKEGEGSTFTFSIPIKGVQAKAGGKELVGWKIS